MAEVTIAALSEAGALTFGDGYRTKRSEHGRPGYRILRVADVADGRVDLDGPDFVSDEYQRAIGSELSQAGDVLLTTKGTVGRVAIFPADVEQVVYSPQLCFFRVTDPSTIHPRFLAYWFKSEAFVRQASHRANNTDMAAYINLGDIASLSLDLPGSSEQQAIAEVLGALDDKIAANAEAIRVADDLSRAHFQSASADGDEVPLSSLARFVNGKAFTKDATGMGRVVIRIAELNSGIGGSTVRNDIEVPDDNTARSGDLLFAWSGSLTAARWYRPEAIVNQHIFKVIPAAARPMWLVNQAVHAKLDEFKSIAADKATTMGHIQRRHLDEPVLVPSAEDVKRLDALMAGLWGAALASRGREPQTHRDSRWLLPLLMSGKVRIRDAEKTVEEVL
ncbi:restriction endonuclease subunit S [Aeromicrobium sp. UC242_57]|uniref:restriction endonuclease subunit S n=1 Tax=Aeromicrobium sp. UC242_57 TaxID=3374624 RepID=UPI003789EAA2